MLQSTITREVTLTVDRAQRLSELASSHQASESEVVEKALDVFFSLADFFDMKAERQAWLRLSEASLNRIWDNPKDAAYDNWREIYGVPEG
ncbi:MAG: hypothetical protein ACPGWR_13280 [Ardenticatenaceae bacterium]